ncbi:AbrB/MazE/SpoVT family DNA-binding domain-containing protein [Haloparvum sedimenti]|uniref:AbrB/MazE/SpoVT family DNA-binding domain-containing protein n=1 Tax=Haloparvum sedimenti TaxID=1678448 RepID=UPI00071E7238|nr:AbrB/MazE/SpoVT family DNA-binding domain-containing protein [Haloparvum sedimenti]
METRKLQEVGGGTFTVSIPKGWATNHGLEEGMELRLYTHHDGSLLVRSTEADLGCLTEATVTVDGGGGDAVRQAVRAAHAAGFETITLRATESFTDAERRAAQATVRELVGTDIAVESETEITVRHLLDASSVSVRQSIVQLQYVAVSLHGCAVAAFLEGDAGAHARVRDRADEARRSAEMIGRHFSRSLVSQTELDVLDVSRPELFGYYVAAERLETVVDRTVRIAGVAERLSRPVPESVAGEVRPAADSVGNAVDDAVTALLDGDMAKARSARERCEEAAARLDGVERSLYEGENVESVPMAVALSSTLDHLRRTAACGRAVTDTAVRATIRAENRDI